MDMMDNNNIDIDKYADYDIQLNQWFHPSDTAIMSKCVKSEETQMHPDAMFFYGF